MSNNHKSEALLSQDLLKKLMIIVIGSIVAAYGITLALYQIVYSTCVDLFATCHVYSTYKWLNFFIIGVLLGGKFGICTIITVIISGPIIQFVNAKAKQILKI